MKALLLSLLLAGCATPHAGPAADVGSTLAAFSLRDGLKEANPILEPAGLYGGAAISLGVRVAINKHYRGKEDCEIVAGLANAIGWGAACNNVAVALGAAPVISLPLLVGCAVAVKKIRADETEAWCGRYELTDLPCTLNNLPVEAHAAQCIDNRLAWK